MKNNYFILLALLFSTTIMGQTYTGSKKDINAILKNAELFSSYVVASNYEQIANSYTDDAKIFPNGLDILDTRAKIIDYWTLPKGLETSYHKIYPKEIVIKEDTAYDYGYYEGKTKKVDGSESHWKGKYVIVWKKIDDKWKMYLDIWNGIRKKE